MVFGIRSQWSCSYEKIEQMSHPFLLKVGKALQVNVVA